MAKDGEFLLSAIELISWFFEWRIQWPKARCVSPPDGGECTFSDEGPNHLPTILNPPVGTKMIKKSILATCCCSQFEMAPSRSFVSVRLWWSDRVEVKVGIELSKTTTTCLPLRFRCRIPRASNLPCCPTGSIDLWPQTQMVLFRATTRKHCNQ